MARPRLLLAVNAVHDSEQEAAWDWLRRLAVVEPERVPVFQLSSELHRARMVWWHHSAGAPVDFGPNSCLALRQWLLAGGGLLLTLHAVALLPDLGLEGAGPDRLGVFPWTHSPEEVVALEGERRGLIGFGKHPIFDRLHGGVFLTEPRKGDYYPEAVYTAVTNGWLVATEWQYLGLDATRKLALEYAIGQGRALTTGAHLLFAQNPNRFRPFLERFAENCLMYLAEQHIGAPPHWPSKASSVHSGAGILPAGRLPACPAAFSAPKPVESRTLESSGHEDAQFDLANGRIIIVGRERTGVTEVWAPPVRLAKRLRARFLVSDSADAGEGRPESRATVAEDAALTSFRRLPESTERTFNLPNATVVQTVCANGEAARIGYRAVSGKLYGLEISWEADLRCFWPYPAGVLGEPTVRESGPGRVDLLDGEGLPRVCVETTPPFDLWRIRRIGDEAIQIECAFLPDACKDVELRLAPARAQPTATIRTELLVRQTTGEPTKSIVLALETPDSSFDEQFFWAVNGLRSFDVESHAGRGLVAGIAETGEGWSSGRLGYAWYFGRDTIWSSFGCLGVGLRDPVRESLRLLARYQQLDGKIFHELTPGGVPHFDAADSTPLFLVGLERYLRWTGDRSLSEELWPAVERALAFCFSTDRDGDGLIENQGVGHGWVEGGRIYGAHCTFYLNACWAEALRCAAAMAMTRAQLMGTRIPDLVERCLAEAVRVRTILNREFYRPETGWFAYGKNQDGTYVSTKTIEPAVGALFGLLDRRRLARFFRDVASERYTTPWGVRFVSNDDPVYHPRGYHHGSVWPLFTGWVATAEYRYRHAEVAFGHVRSSLGLIRRGSLGSIDEVLDGDTGEPAGVCPHQLWAHAMTVTPVVEGMLGIVPDGFANSLAVRPQLPDGWEFLRVRNLQVGSHSLSFSLTRHGERFDMAVDEHGGPCPLRVSFAPPGLRSSWRKFSLLARP